MPPNAKLLVLVIISINKLAAVHQIQISFACAVVKSMNKLSINFFSVTKENFKSKKKLYR